MTNTQNELQASHESEVKRLHSDKKAVQRDLTSTKSKTKNLEEAKNKFEMEVCAFSWSSCTLQFTCCIFMLDQWVENGLGS